MKKKSFLLRLSIGLCLSLIIIFVFLLFPNNSINDSKRNIGIETPIVPDSATKFKTVALVSNNMQDRFVSDVFKLIKEKSKTNENIIIKIFDSNGNKDKQQLIIQNQIENNVDCIVLSPLDTNLPINIVNKLKSVDIPIININCSSTDNFFSSSVNQHFKEIGETQAKFIVEKAKGIGNLIVFTGQINLPSSAQMLLGFNKIIKDYPNIKVIKINYDSLSQEEKLIFFREFLKKYNSIDGIVIQYTNLSAEVLSLLFKSNAKPPIIGYDSLPEVFDFINEDKLDSTIYINEVDIAEFTYNIIMKAIKKQEILEPIIVPYKLITKDNLFNYTESNLDNR